jgi:hypothetical protein
MLRQNGWNYDQIPLDFDGVRRPDQVFEERSELERTVAALNELPERQRDALVMREFEGRSYNEIAVALGANDGAVRQLLNRARVTLRGAMSALIPPPLVARAAASLPPSDGRRMAELISGLSAAGVAKAGATALVAGSLVVGAVEAPLPIGASHKTTRQKATLSAAGNSTPAKAAHNPATPVVHRAAIARPRTSGESHSGRSGGHETEHRGSGETEHHSSRGETREESRSGSDDGTRNRSGSSDDSVTRTESGERSGSGRSGSGSDDVTTTAVPETTNSGPSLSSGSGSGSDDSVTSGSGSSGSGTSGSGTSSPETSGSGTSGSGTSGSGTSGSGSGSDDGLTTHD